MPQKQVSMSNEMFNDIFTEMKSTGKLFSQVVNRRLNKLKEIEANEKP